MSYGGNADPSGIQVTFLDQTGAKSVKAVIAFSVPVSRIIPNIITKMSLPATSPDGQPMSYSLDHKEGGRRLLESWTLVEAGVQNGDHLIVYPEVVAGRSERTGTGRPRTDAIDRPRTRPDHVGLRDGRRRRRRADSADGPDRPTHQQALASTAGVARPCTNLLACAVSTTTWRPSSGSARKARSSASRATGDPPQHYRILFQGKGLWRDRGKVKILEKHRVEIKLGASYPRTMPEIRWLTPIYHPNISEIGMVCLGGYGTHWVPSVQLDELCMMLWDMAAVPQLRHSQPLQPRCRALGRAARRRSGSRPTPVRSATCGPPWAEWPRLGTTGAAEPRRRPVENRAGPARRRSDDPAACAASLSVTAGSSATPRKSRGRVGRARPRSTGVAVQLELHDLVAAQAARRRRIEPAADASRCSCSTRTRRPTPADDGSDARGAEAEAPDP